MSITLGIYDVFSYAIPGILYLFTLYEFMRFIQKPIELPLENSLYLLLLALLSYLVGHLFDHISRHLWYRRFYPEKSPERAFSRFEKHFNIKTEVTPRQWPILLSVIRHTNSEVSTTIEKNKATSIMLRNVSFSLFLLFLILAISAFFPVFSLTYLISAVVALALSIVSMRRGDEFNQWFYLEIFQQSLIYGKSIKEILDSNHQSASSGTVRKRTCKKRW